MLIKKFYLSKQAILLNSVELSKIVVSSKWKISDTKYKYFCGYLNNDVIQPLCVILSQMSGYIKYFDDDGKNMSFVTDDKEIYEKYNEIWEVIRKLLKLKFTVSPIRDDKYIIAKLKTFKNLNITTFTNNGMPKENTRYTYIYAIDIDSVLKIDKKSFPQAYLEQRKYKLKKKNAQDILIILKLLIMIVKMIVIAIVLVMLKLKVKKKLKILNYLDNHHDHL